MRFLQSTHTDAAKASRVSCGPQLEGCAAQQCVQRRLAEAAACKRGRAALRMQVDVQTVTNVLDRWKLCCSPVRVARAC